MALSDEAIILQAELDRALAERDMLRREIKKLRRPGRKLAITISEDVQPRPGHRPRCGLCGQRPCQCGLEAYP